MSKGAGGGREAGLAPWRQGEVRPSEPTELTAADLDAAYFEREYGVTVYPSFPDEMRPALDDALRDDHQMPRGWVFDGGGGFEKPLAFRGEDWADEIAQTCGGSAASGFYDASRHVIVMKSPSMWDSWGAWQGVMADASMRAMYGYMLSHEMGHARWYTDQRLAKADKDLVTTLWRTQSTAHMREHGAGGLPYHFVNEREFFAEAYAAWHFPRGGAAHGKTYPARPWRSEALEQMFKDLGWLNLEHIG